ncbi:hypothetical protein PXD56_02550 [Maribacter sp. SA7]|uniref:hypothetical protein n=1 Tax=Maribacter zhoushanensis TaxID=3030012 RepID=UPI0023ECA12D|nr:hypothetical protein [Maribacter zhoushanensis]MDF4201817.1 hypothetical protein [Maribacter zhoushanensis]
MGASEFSDIINPIIRDNRKISLSDAKNERFVRSNEAKFFLDKLGVDIRYQGRLIELRDNSLRKEEIEKKIPYLSTKTFRFVISTIISENREIPLEKAKLKRYIYPIEVMAFLKQIGEDEIESENYSNFN